MLNNDSKHSFFGNAANASIFLMLCLLSDNTLAETAVIHTTGIAVNTDASSTRAASGGLDLDLNNDYRIAVDGTYFLTPRIGINVLATTLNFEVDSAGTSLGSVSVLPPIVTLQYHFSPDDPKLRPYISLGFNYNIFYNESGVLDTLAARVDDTFGFVAGGGFDLMIFKNVSLNADLKYLSFKADVNVGGAKADSLDVDAVIVGIGFAYHF